MQPNTIQYGQIIVANTIHNYKLRRSRRARHILLHVNLDGSIELVVPWHVAYKHARLFLEQKREWLASCLKKNKRLAQTIPRRQLNTGAQLPFFTANYQLVVQTDPGRRRVSIKQTDNVLTITAASHAQIRGAVVKWYRQHSRDFLTGQAIALAAKIQVRVKDIRILNTKSQWGSCNKHKGILTFHWGLALAPAAVARYVVAHEVAHLKLTDHSPAFWQLVAQLCPDYYQHRLWLKRHGYQLTL